MKLHIGVDSQTGLAHSAVVTAANVHDKHPLRELMHDAEEKLYADSAYASQQALIPLLSHWCHAAEGERGIGIPAGRRMPARAFSVHRRDEARRSGFVGQRRPQRSMAARTRDSA